MAIELLFDFLFWSKIWLWQIKTYMANKNIEKTKTHFLETFKQKRNPVYPYLPRHVIEAEKWAKKILKSHPEADEEIVLLSVWLHDIGLATKDENDDHAVQSETETRRFLTEMGMTSDKIEKVAHCVRAHRCKDVKPSTLEAKILAAADSASHMTDINYIVHISDGLRDYTLAKLERDYRDVGLFPELKKEITPLYKAWRELLSVYPDLNRF